MAPTGRGATRTHCVLLGTRIFAAPGTVTAARQARVVGMVSHGSGRLSGFYGRMTPELGATNSGSKGASWLPELWQWVVALFQDDRYGSRLMSLLDIEIRRIIPERDVVHDKDRWLGLVAQRRAESATCSRRHAVNLVPLDEFALGSGESPLTELAFALLVAGHVDPYSTWVITHVVHG